MTTSVNNKRALERGERAKKTHCLRGHEYNESNTYKNGANGKRYCKTCAKFLLAESRRKARNNNNNNNQKVGPQ